MAVTPQQQMIVIPPRLMKRVFGCPMNYDSTPHLQPCASRPPARQQCFLTRRPSSGSASSEDQTVARSPASAVKHSAQSRSKTCSRSRSGPAQIYSSENRSHGRPFRAFRAGLSFLRAFQALIVGGFAKLSLPRLPHRPMTSTAWRYCPMLFA